MGNAWVEFVQSQTEGTGASTEAIACEYRAIREACALVNRSDRALLRVTGADRASWLHNLTTNQVKNLGGGEGNYAFVLNLKGRILFDVNISARPDCLLLDVDRRCLSVGLAHFEKYTITEDVTVTDVSDTVERFGLTGPRIPALLGDVGVTQLNAMPDFGTMTGSFAGRDITIIRHDFSGTLGVEIITESGAGAALWEFLASAGRQDPGVVVGEDALDIHRIECGLPRYPQEINDDVLPGETGQSERAVSFQKGCYLGQEVVERMRSRGVVARKLRGLVLEGAAIPPGGSELVDAGGHAIGRVTSACHSIGRNAVVGLGYIKTGSSAAGIAIAVRVDGGLIPGTVADLPLVKPSTSPV